MPINPNIALQIRPPEIESPLNALAKVSQVQNAMNQNRLVDMQVADSERKQQRQNALMQATRNAFDPETKKINPDKYRGALAEMGDYEGLQSFEKSQSEQNKAALESKKAKIEAALKQFEAIGQIMSGARDQASYDAARQSAAQILGPEALTNMPAVYDPAVIEQGRLKAMSVKEQMEQAWKKLDSDLKASEFEYRQKNDAANRSITMRGQNMTDARARDLAKATREAGGKPPSGYRYKPDGSMEVIPGGPADLKTQALDQQKAIGESDVAVALASLRDAYDRLEKGGGITSTNKDALSNLSASTSSSGFGQMLGKTFGTDNQSARNDIAMTRPALLAALMKATGMSAKQMDSNAELKLWLSTATDPTLDVESNRRALNNIERKYIKGGDQSEKPPNAPDPRGVAGPKRITSDADYNALPSGAEFIDPNGQKRRKP